MVTENVFRLYNRKIGSNNKSEKNKKDSELKRKQKGFDLNSIWFLTFLSRNFANQTLELNGMRKELEDDFNHKKKVVTKAYMENNRTSVTQTLISQF